MSMGAIFARGSCRALKWMALFGVVFALGAGSAAAQVEPTSTPVELSIKSVKIGTSTSAAASAAVSVRENTVVDVEVTLSAKVPDAHNDADDTSPNETSVALALTVVPTSEAAGGIAGIATATKGAAEENDIQIGDVDLTSDGFISDFRIWEEGEETVTFQLELNHDDDAVNEKFTLTFTLAGPEQGNPGSIIEGESVVTLKADSAFMRTVTIVDDETQTYELDVTDAAANIKEGTPINVELEANPARPAAETVTLHVFVDNDNYEVSSREFMFDEEYSTRAFTVDLEDAEDSDGDRDPDTISVSANMVDPDDIRKIDEVDSVEIVVNDIHSLPAADKITAKAYMDDDGEKDEDEEVMSVMEGGDPVHVTVTVDRGEEGYPNNEMLEVTLMPTDPTQGLDYRLSDTEVEIPVDEDEVDATMDVMLWALADEDVGEETLMFNLVAKGADSDDNGPGERIGTFSIMIVDATTPLVSVKDPGAYDAIKAERGEDDEPLNPGGGFSVMTSDLFSYDEAFVDVSFAVSVAGTGVTASATGDAVMVEAHGATEGDGAKVTVTATATPKADSLLITQDRANVAQLAFPVKVVLADLTVTVTADPLEIMEGGTSIITATSSRPIAASDGEVKVDLVIVGAATLDEDGTVTQGIVIGMDQTIGYTVLTATNDDVYKEDQTVTVAYSGDEVEAPGQIVITVNDNDDPPTEPEPTVTATSPEDVQASLDGSFGSDFTPGAMVTFGFGALFETFPEGADVAMAVESSDGSIVSVGNLSGHDGMVTAVAAGSATITVTATDRTSGDSDTAMGDVTVSLANLTMEVMADPMAIDEGGTSMITATASRMIDASDGMVTVNLTVVGDGTLDADSITIAADSESGSVMLTSTEDDDYEDETVTVIASGAGIMGNMPVEIAVTDNDMAPPAADSTVRAKDGAAMMIASAIATAAGGSDWMVGGMAATLDMSDLFDVDAGVTAAISGGSSDPAVVRDMTSGTTLTLTPMGAGSATITVTASDPVSTDVATVSHDAMVALQTLSIGVKASADMVDEGMSVTVTATANRAVTAETMLAVTVTGDTAAVLADEMITISMGEMSGTGMVMAVEDADSADAMVSVVVSGAGISGGAASLGIAITDNDPTVSGKSAAEVNAVFTVATAMAGGDAWLPGGDAATLDMSELFDTNDSPTLEYTAMSSDEDMVMASASGSTLTLTPMATGDATITVTATDTSGDMYDTAEVMSMVTVGVLPLEITVTPATAEITEGESVEITAMLNKMEDSNVEVMLLPDVTASTAVGGADGDYEVTPSMMITIMAGGVTGKATLMATDDYMVEDTETVKLVARHKDLGNIGTVTVSIMDNDMESTYTLTGPMDMNIVEGMSYELTATASQMVRMNTEVMITRDRGASDAGEDDYMVESIMIPAGATSGTTMLMVTEDNMPDAGTGTNMGQSLVLVGSVDGMEIGTLAFTIWDAAVPALPLIAQLLLAAFLAIGGYRRYLRR